PDAVAAASWSDDRVAFKLAVTAAPKATSAAASRSEPSRREVQKTSVAPASAKAAVAPSPGPSSNQRAISIRPGTMAPSNHSGASGPALPNPSKSVPAGSESVSSTSTSQAAP